MAGTVWRIEARVVVTPELKIANCQLNMDYDPQGTTVRYFTYLSFILLDVSDISHIFPYTYSITDYVYICIYIYIYIYIYIVYI